MNRHEAGRFLRKASFFQISKKESSMTQEFFFAVTVNAHTYTQRRVAFGFFELEKNKTRRQIKISDGRRKTS